MTNIKTPIAFIVDLHPKNTRIESHPRKIQALVAPLCPANINPVLG